MMDSPRRTDWEDLTKAKHNDAFHRSVYRWLLLKTKHASEERKNAAFFWYWFVITFVVGAGVAAIALILWTTISPFDAGTDILEEVDNRNKLFGILVSIALLIFFVLYLLDFYTAPHLRPNGQLYLVSHDDDDLMKMGITKQMSDKEISKANSYNLQEYATLYDEEHEIRKKKFFVMGQTEVSTPATFIAQLIFFLAILMMLTYGLLNVRNFPTRPILLTLLLFPVLQQAVRYLLITRITGNGPALRQIKNTTDVMNRVIVNTTEYKLAKATLETLLDEFIHYEDDKGIYFKAAALSTSINVVILVGIYAYWTYGKPGWNWDEDSQEEYTKRGVERENMQWAIWAGPGLVIVTYVMFTFLFLMRWYLHEAYKITDERYALLKDSMKHQHIAKKLTENEHIAADKMDDAVHTVKMSVCGLIMCGFAFWVSAEVAGGNKEAANTVKQFLAAFLVFFAAFLVLTMNRLFKRIKSMIKEHKFLKLMIGVFKSDWLKGTTLLLVPYLMPFYFFTSWLNQKVRSCRGIDDQRNIPGSIEADPHRLLTKLGAGHLAWLKILNWTSIINKAYIMGMILFTLNVMAERMLYLCLIYVGDGFDRIILADVEKAILVLFLYYVVGMVGFLLPPVPGPPIYLFGGVVVVRQFAQINAKEGETLNDSSFWLGCIIVVLVSWVLKLNACAMQQKAIGEALGARPWIRAACGVNKPFIRALEMVLQEKGLSYGKCAILCGGPDWPTSVLCGLLKCDLLQMMIGSLPVVIFIAPFVLTGAFFLRTEPVYASAGTFLFVVSMVVCTTFGVSAGYAVQEYLDSHPIYLTIPLRKNRELDWIEYCQQRRADVYNQLCKWNTLPFYLKFWMIFGLLLMNFSGIVFAWYGDSCFGSFDLQTPSHQLGDEVTIITTLGKFAIGIFGFSCLIFYLYRKELKRLSKPKIDELDARLDDPKSGEYDKWEAGVEQKITEMEQEMRNEAPEDYMMYLEAANAWKGSQTKYLELTSPKAEI